MRIENTEGIICIYPFNHEDVCIMCFKQNREYKVKWDETPKNMPLNDAKLFNQAITLAITLIETGNVFLLEKDDRISSFR